MYEGHSHIEDTWGYILSMQGLENDMFAGTAHVQASMVTSTALSYYNLLQSYYNSPVDTIVAVQVIELSWAQPNMQPLNSSGPISSYNPSYCPKAVIPNRPLKFRFACTGAPI